MPARPRAHQPVATLPSATLRACGRHTSDPGVTDRVGRNRPDAVTRTAGCGQSPDGSVGDADSPQPRIHDMSRIRPGCRCRNSVTTARPWILRKEALLRCERLPPKLDPQRRTDPDVPDPVGVLAPRRADDRLVSFRVMPEHHGGSDVGLAGLPSGVDQEQERVTEQPAPSPAIQQQRQPEAASARRPGCLRSPSSGLALRPGLAVMR